MSDRTFQENLSYRVTTGIATGLFAQGMMALLGLAFVPYIVGKLGADEYALLSFSLALVGYFSFIDLGLSNSVVRFLSEYDGQKNVAAKQAVLSTGICLYPILGIAAGVLLTAGTPFLVMTILRLPTDLHGTGLTIFYITAVGLPVMLMKAYFEAIPLAHQRVSTLNTVNLVLNCSKLVCTVLLLSRGFGLVAVVSCNVIVSTVHMFSMFWLSTNCLAKGFRFQLRINLPLLRAMLLNGFFVSVTNLTSQVMLNVDKLIIGALLPMRSLSYYVIAYELASKLWYIPNQITRAHFPTFGYLWGKGGLSNLFEQYQRALREVAIGVTFIAMFAFVYADVILRFWVGSEFAQFGAKSLQLLILGLMMSCFGSGPYSLLIAIGSAGATARIRFVVMITNVTLCLDLVPRYGIDGAAWAWLVSNCLDAVLLNWRVDSQIFSGAIRWFLVRVMLPVALISTVALASVWLLRLNAAKGFVNLMLAFCFGYLGCIFASYRFVLDEEERGLIRSTLARVVAAK